MLHRVSETQTAAGDAGRTDATNQMFFSFRAGVNGHLRPVSSF